MNSIIFENITYLEVTYYWSWEKWRTVSFQIKQSRKNSDGFMMWPLQYLLLKFSSN